MKKQCVLLLVMLTIICGISVSAKAQTQQGESQKIFINKKGGIINQAGTQLGYIDKANVVRNNKGEKLYFIDDKGNVIGANGEKLGMAKKNGTYTSVNGETVLTTKDLDKEKCAILDPQGHEFGNAHMNYKLHACAAHCYFLERAKMKKEKEEKAKAKG